ncbi:MAG: WYL domain-containing protein, partial [Flavobacteriales bacterium]|nr:WYL domain-containing protein [Flavobacteriales bacterium]
MSVNKHAIIRYQALDRCFRNPGRMYFWEDLLEECNKALLDFDPSCKGIQRRQLFDDIRFMESAAGWSIPLARHRYGKRVYYRYEDLSFSINNQPLNELEAEYIKS